MPNLLDDIQPSETPGIPIEQVVTTNDANWVTFDAPIDDLHRQLFNRVTTRARQGARRPSADILRGIANDVYNSNTVERMPIPSRDSVASDVPMTPFQAIQALNDVYGIDFDKKKRIAETKEEVIIRDPDPVNDEEEAIINIEELAGTLADMDMEEHGETVESHPEKYNQLQGTYKDLIVKHKRKINV